MSRLDSAWMTLNPSKTTWFLSLPVNDSAVNKTFSVRMGADNRFHPVVVRRRVPADHSFQTKMKINRNAPHYKVGPLIGILTVKGDQTPFSGNRKNFADIISTAKKMGGLVFVFTPEDIDWENREVKGYLLNRRKKHWFGVSLPLPDIVYNRVPYRKNESEPFVQRTLQKLEAVPGLYLYNPRFFNKWELFQNLKSLQRVNSYLPETQILRSVEDVESFLQVYRAAYLKPIRGKAGKGIMKVEKKGKLIALYSPSDKSTKKYFFSNPALAWRKISRWIENKPYLIQQAIPLASYKNRPFDIRLLLQRDGKGRWQLTGTGIRVAGKGRITTHVPRGGTIASPQKVFREVFPDIPYEQLIQKIKTAALTIIKGLEEKQPQLGECSMDIGIDKKGELWFFEANAKPMKFDEPHIRKRSLARTIEYAQFKAGFQHTEGRIGYANQVH